MFRTNAFRLVAVAASLISLAACTDQPSSALTSPDRAAFSKGADDPKGDTRGRDSLQGPRRDDPPGDDRMGARNDQRTRTIIALTAPAGAVFRGANGKAKFDARPGERELQIEVEDIPAGTAVVFRVDGAAIGSGVADTFGNARLELNSERGDTVPLTMAGRMVSVTTAAGIVVSGRF
jgi:hypothetical protein